MRARADEERIRAFLRAVGRSAARPARLYLVGGATAVLHGWRATTIDIDIRLEPEDDAVLRAVAELKNRLDVNVELAAPPDFIPELPGWHERSPFLTTPRRSHRAGPGLTVGETAPRWASERQAGIDPG